MDYSGLILRARESTKVSLRPACVQMYACVCVVYNSLKELCVHNAPGNMREHVHTLPPPCVYVCIYIYTAFACVSMLLCKCAVRKCLCNVFMFLHNVFDGTTA